MQVYTLTPQFLLYTVYYIFFKKKGGKTRMIAHMYIYMYVHVHVHVYTVHTRIHTHIHPSQYGGRMALQLLVFDTNYDPLHPTIPKLT